MSETVCVASEAIFILKTPPNGEGVRLNFRTAKGPITQYLLKSTQWL